MQGGGGGRGPGGHDMPAERGRGTVGGALGTGPPSRWVVREGKVGVGVMLARRGDSLVACSEVKRTPPMSTGGWKGRGQGGGDESGEDMLA